MRIGSDLIDSYLWAKNSATASIEGEVAVANFGDLGKTLAPLALAQPAMAGWSVPHAGFHTNSSPFYKFYLL